MRFIRTNSTDSGDRSPLLVLDACSGPGRFSLEFARKGHTVTAVDIVQPFLEALEETAHSENLSVKTLCCDILAFTAEDAFDIVLNLYTSFGYFETKEDDIKLLTITYKALKPGGWLFLELLSKEMCARYFSAGEWFEKDNALICTQFKVDDGWNYLHNRWIVVRDGVIADNTWNLRLYAYSELQEILTGIGFSEIRSFGSYGFSPYDDNAETLLVAARK